MLCKRGVGSLIYMYECIVTVFNGRMYSWSSVLGVDLLSDVQPRCRTNMYLV